MRDPTRVKHLSAFMTNDYILPIMLVQLKVSKGSEWRLMNECITSSTTDCITSLGGGVCVIVEPSLGTVLMNLWAAECCIRFFWLNIMEGEEFAVNKGGGELSEELQPAYLELSISSNGTVFRCVEGITGRELRFVGR